MPAEPHPYLPCCTADCCLNSHPVPVEQRPRVYTVIERPAPPPWRARRPELGESSRFVSVSPELPSGPSFAEGG